MDARRTNRVAEAGVSGRSKQEWRGSMCDVNLRQVRSVDTGAACDVN